MSRRDNPDKDIKPVFPGLDEIGRSNNRISKRLSSTVHPDEMNEYNDFTYFDERGFNGNPKWLGEA